MVMFEKEINVCQCSNNSMDLNPHQVECNEGSFHSVELSQHENHLDNDVGWLLHRSVSNEFVEEGLFLSLPFRSCPSVLVSDKSPSDVLRLSPIISTQLSVSLKRALSKVMKTKNGNANKVYLFLSCFFFILCGVFVEIKKHKQKRVKQ